MNGGKGAGWHGSPGGRFSLGRWKEGSGYCVGAAVETRMGVAKYKGGAESGREEGNGMKGVWVLGEAWLRGVSGVFDVSSSRGGRDLRSGSR